MNQSDSSNNFKSSLVNLYMKIKSQIYGTDNIEEWKENCQNINTSQMIHYIEESIGILINVKIEDSLKKQDIQTHEPSTVIEVYEELIRKLEADIRNHIKIEYQLKLQNDFLESQLENYEVIDEDQTDRLKRRSNPQNHIDNNIIIEDGSEENFKEDREIIIIRAENSKLKSAIAALENQLKKFEDINLVKAQYENEISMYKAKIDKLSKRIARSKETSSNINININENGLASKWIIKAKEAKEGHITCKKDSEKKVELIINKSNYKSNFNRSSSTTNGKKRSIDKSESNIGQQKTKIDDTQQLQTPLISSRRLFSDKEKDDNLNLNLNLNHNPHVKNLLVKSVEINNKRKIIDSSLFMATYNKVFSDLKVNKSESPFQVKHKKNNSMTMNLNDSKKVEIISKYLHHLPNQSHSQNQKQGNNLSLVNFKYENKKEKVSSLSRYVLSQVKRKGPLSKIANGSTLNMRSSSISNH